MDNTNDPVRVLREALAALVNLDQRCGWHSKEQDNAIRVLAAIPHSEQRETVAAGEVQGTRALAQQVLEYVYARVLMHDKEQLIEEVESILAPVAAPVPEAKAEQVADANEICQLAPAGWYCTRKAGHDGPCAAHQHEPDRELDADDHASIAAAMQRIATPAAPAVKHEASELPPLPKHPRSPGVEFCNDELRAIEAYGQACIDSRSPVAAAPLDPMTNLMRLNEHFKALGWRDMYECPTDIEVEFMEFGSTGIHKGVRCENGDVFLAPDGEWSYPILWRALSAAAPSADAKDSGHD